MLKDILIKSRSYRRFDEAFSISSETLRELVDITRYTPSTVNSQALKFRIVNNKTENSEVFKTLHFAGLLKGKGTPEEGERPSAYIIILTDLSLGRDKRFDDGIAAQTIMLGAAEKGLGGCMIGSFEKDELFSALDIDPEKYSIDLILALGKPIETVVITEVGEDGSMAYYRDKNKVHYVPKRKLDDIII